MVDAPPRGHPELSAALAALLRGGARSAEVLDARTSAVVAAAGPDGPRDAAIMVALAGRALRAAVAEGGLTDLVLTTSAGVHLLWPVEAAGAIVHVRLDHGQEGGHDGVAAVRATLTGPEFGALVLAALHRPAPPAAVAPAGPRPRPSPVPRPLGPSARPPGLSPPHPGSAPEEAPAREPGSSSTGALAVLALDAAVPERPDAASRDTARDTPTPPYPMPVVRQLPRRGPRSAGTWHEPSWAEDVHTMQRVLSGLRRLA
jgi:hypothetical protein